MIAALLTSALLLCEEPKPIPMQASAYCDYGTTADGSTTIEHLTCAGKREWFGRTIALYRRNKDDSIGEFIGYYEIHDIGSDTRIKNGQSIDIYMPIYDDCIQFGRIDVYMFFIEGEG